MALDQICGHLLDEKGRRMFKEVWHEGDANKISPRTVGVCDENLCDFAQLNVAFVDAFLSGFATVKQPYISSKSHCQ